METVNVQKEVMDAALLELQELLEPSWGPQEQWSKPLIEGLVVELKGNLEACGGCDHSVGICTEPLQEALYGLELALQGEVVCPQCGGEGFVFTGIDPDTDMETFSECPRTRPWEDR